DASRLVPRRDEDGDVRRVRTFKPGVVRGLEELLPREGEERERAAREPHVEEYPGESDGQQRRLPSSVLAYVRASSSAPASGSVTVNVVPRPSPSLSAPPCFTACTKESPGGPT